MASPLNPSAKERAINALTMLQGGLEVLCWKIEAHTK